MIPNIDEMIADFWYESGPARGASAAELDLAEKRLGFELPAELRRLLAVRDGGVSNFGLFEDIVLAPFRGVAHGAGTGDLVALHLAGGVDTLPTGVVIFAADADAWFGLDYRENARAPSILHWSEYEDGPIELAGSFRQFLMNLRRD